MRASYLASFALLAFFSLAEPLVATPSIADPTITAPPQIPHELLFKKQDDVRYIGWISWSGEWTQRTCDYGGTFYSDNDDWRCCATSLASCNGPIGCIGGSLIYSFATGTVSRGTYACSEVYTDPADYSFSICNTGFMYENTNDPDPKTNIFCGVSSLNWSYYRQKPEESTTSSEESSTTSPSTTVRTTTSTSASPFPIGTAEPKKEKSKAWIAGAVVGPVAGLALLGALLWFLLARRKKNQTSPQQPQPSMQQQAPGGPYPPQGYVGSPNPPPPAPSAEYYNPQVAQKQANMVPYGVASHNSWIPQPPQSPTTQGSHSPQPPPQSPYGSPPPAQQWNSQNQQVYNNQPPTSPPSQSPPPQIMQAGMVDNGGVNKQSGVGVSERPFSAELDSSQQQHQNMAQYVPSWQQPGQQQPQQNYVAYSPPPPPPQTGR